MQSGEQQKCLACEGTEIIPVNLGFGYKGNKCRVCGLVWAVDVSGTKQLYESAYDESSEGFVWHGYLDAYQKAKSTQQVSLYWFEKYFLKKIKPFGSGNLLFNRGCGTPNKAQMPSGSLLSISRR